MSGKETLEVLKASQEKKDNVQHIPAKRLFLFFS